MAWKVYLLRCADNSLYCGITTDIDARIAKHNAGKGAKYTRARLPVELAAVSDDMPKSKALMLEHRIKQLPADKKIEALKNSKADSEKQKLLECVTKKFEIHGIKH